MRSSARARTSCRQPLVAPPPSARRPSARTCRGRAGGRCPAAPGLAAADPPASASTSVPVGVPGARVDDEAGGLVDDEQVLVLAGDAAARPAARPPAARLRRRARASPRPRAGSSSAAARPSTSTPGRDRALGRRRASRRARRGSGRAARPRPRSRRGRTGVRQLAPADAARAHRAGRAQRWRSRPPAAQARRPRATQRGASRIATPTTMKRVGEVERRPPAEVEEVRHVAEAHAVDEVRDAAADQQPERRREHRVPRAGAREEDDHPADGDRRQHDHDRRRATRRGRRRCRSSARGGSRTARRRAPTRRARARS